jgi:hypothetical protein
MRTENNSSSKKATNNTPLDRNVQIRNVVQTKVDKPFQAGLTHVVLDAL